MQIPHLHFKILALAPYATAEPSADPEGAALPVDRFSLDDAIGQMACSCFLPLEKSLCPDEGLDLHFNDLKAFHPDGMLKGHPFLQDLHAAAEFIENSRQQGESTAAIQSGLRQWPDLPPMRVSEPAAAKTAPGAKTLDNLLDMVALPDQSHDKADHTANPAQAVLRQVVSQLLMLPELRTMEAAWRGLRFLLQHGVLEENLRVEIANIRPDVLEENLNALTPALINDLPGVILLDQPFGNTPLAMEQLAAAARWAADLMVPLVAWVPPEFLHISGWEELGTLPFIPSHLETPAYAKFRTLKASAEGKWLCLTCNRFLVRYPYGADNPPRKIALNEPTPLWISPVWALGTLLAQAVGNTGWPTRFTDLRSFSLQDLAVIAPAKQPPIPTETLLDRDRLDQLARAGLTPLAAEGGRDKAFVPRAVTLQGGSLAEQLLLSQLTRFILWCKDNLPSETGEVSLKTQLQLAFQVYSEQSRPAGFAAVDITTRPAGADGRIPVTIRITPAAAILPSQAPIELTLDW